MHRRGRKRRSGRRVGEKLSKKDRSGESVIGGDSEHEILAIENGEMMASRLVMIAADMV